MMTMRDILTRKKYMIKRLVKLQRVLLAELSADRPTDYIKRDIEEAIERIETINAVLKVISFPNKKAKKK